MTICIGLNICSLKKCSSQRSQHYLPPLTNLYMSATADDKGHTPFNRSTNGAKSSPETHPPSMLLSVSQQSLIPSKTYRASEDLHPQIVNWHIPAKTLDPCENKFKLHINPNSLSMFWSDGKANNKVVRILGDGYWAHIGLVCHDGHW
jgi:hypothetical protein